MPTFLMYNQDRFYALQNANPDQDSKYQPKSGFCKNTAQFTKMTPQFPTQIQNHTLVLIA